MMIPFDLCEKSFLLELLLLFKIFVLKLFVNSKLTIRLAFQLWNTQLAVLWRASVMAVTFTYQQDFSKVIVQCGHFAQFFMDFFTICGRIYFVKNLLCLEEDHVSPWRRADDVPLPTSQV